MSCGKLAEGSLAVNTEQPACRHHAATGSSFSRGPGKAVKAIIDFIHSTVLNKVLGFD